MMRTMSTNGSPFPTDEELQHLLVGPDSISWRYGSDVRLYFVMLYPLLLQVAHPTVGAGVKDYSDFETRPWNRLLRTLDYVGLLIYGGSDAPAMGRRLRALHKGFRGVRADGQRYYALEPEAYAWVHATLLHSYVAGHARFGRPMRRDQIERFYGEYRGLGRLVGVREHDLPTDWEGFCRYFDGVIASTLEHTESVDRVLRAVTDEVPPPVPMPRTLWRAARLPARRALYLGGTGLLSAELRERFGMRWHTRDDTEFRALGRASRAITPLMPRRMLISGPDQLRLRRHAITRGPLGSDAEPVSNSTSSERTSRGATAAA
jgi:uncharacterized protein (DUF2236 family)